MSLVRADAIAIPLADESVDLIVTSPPYFALRSYTDGGEHYAGQIGSEPTPQDFLRALWAVTDECWRVLKPGGSCWVNLGDKYNAPGAGSRNGQGSTEAFHVAPSLAKRNALGSAGAAAVSVPGFSRRPNRDVLSKSLMGLPWSYALGCFNPERYRAPFETAASCWHGEPEGRCFACRPSFPQWIARAEVVWSKPNGLPESVTDRVRRSHEQWFHFTKEPRYFAAVDEVREAHKDVSWIGRDVQERTNTDRNDGGKACVSANPLGKLPGSVWSIPSEPLKVPDWLDVDHFAAFPQEWPRRIILGWSPSAYCTKCDEPRRPITVRTSEGRPRTDGNRRGERGLPGYGDVNRDAWAEGVRREITGYACACDQPTAPTRPAVILDPFGGTGTVAMTARALGRYPVHIDLSADYLRLARWRIYDSGHAAKSTARTNRERQGTLL